MAAKQGLGEPLREVTIGAPKSRWRRPHHGGDWPEAAGEGIRYVLGERTVGVPTLRNLDPIWEIRPSSCASVRRR